MEDVDLAFAKEHLEDLIAREARGAGRGRAHRRSEARGSEVAGRRRGVGAKTNAWTMAGPPSPTRRFLPAVERKRTGGFELLGITVDHVRMAGLTPHAHRDPFDRLLSAQATIEGLTLVSADVRLRALGAPCLW